MSGLPAAHLPSLSHAHTVFKDQLQEFSKLNKKDKKDKKTKTKVTVFISTLWNKAPMSVRTRYFDMAMQDKFRYYREKSEYEEDLERWQLQQQQQQQQQQVVLNNESTSSNRSDADGDDSTDASVPEIYDPLSSRDAISHLADQLDTRSIDFLIRALK